MDAGVKALYQGMAQQMLRFFTYRGLTGDEAKDALQDTFVNIVRGATGFSGEGAAKSWIWQVARNCLTDYLRKLSRQTEDEVVVNDEHWRLLESTKAGPDLKPSGVTVDECVSGGLDAFGKQMPERAYVLTLQMDGLSITEIGERIGRSTAATREYLSQCRKKLEPFVAHCMDLLRV
jgi:RNA polymerase sigma factor (sigma-70 family)